MKKVFSIKDFDNLVKNSLIIAFRKKDELTIANLECLPPSRMRIEHDAENREIKLIFQVNDNEYLALGDITGVAKKKVIKGK